MRKILTNLDEVCAYLSRRKPSAQHRSAVAVICAEDGDGSSKPVSLALDNAPGKASKPDEDEKKTCARFVISTENKDRHGDVVRAQGVLEDDWIRFYIDTPRVFFSHKSHEKPIGSARDPQTGKTTLEVHDDHLAATVYFHQKTQESTEICALVMCGELEATSIGFLPHKAVVLQAGEPIDELAEDDEIIFDDLGQGLEF